ncbi:thioredoxin [Moniliophthora roreri MCA 2997]|uniref:Thioredoxin n=1 Tax=Moniliophthora roreri (strain MCA 2997) TaxID=1381753 RepID=V2WMF1_MONRO|nr:thioredoxin [Moniliophthora roreri MCA 2997]
MTSLLNLRILKSASANQSIKRSVLPSLTAKRTFRVSSKCNEYYPDANFSIFKEVVQGEKGKGRLVLVDFYAGWCRPCHMLSPILKAIATDKNVKSGTGKPVDVVTIDTESTEGMELGQRYKVRALPTVIAFCDGQQALQFVGALPEDGVKDFLKQV